MLNKVINKLVSNKEKNEENKSNKKNYLILGASAAGINAAKTLRDLDLDSNITIISKDEKVYSRCMLHHVISNHRTVEEINFVEDNFMENNNIYWIKNKSIKSIDTKKKKVVIEGQEIGYDKLLIATGASSFIPPIKNIKEGNYIYTLRNIDDVYKIKEKAKISKKAAIIGAGLIGIDALTGLMEYESLELSLIYPSNYILDRQLDEYSAKVYESKFIEKGVSLYSGQSVNEIILDEENNVSGVQLGNGTVVECDLLIVSTGVTPNIDFIRETGIENNRGIVINDKCESTVNDVYAAGDVVGKNAIWPLAVKQGIVAAYNMVGIERNIDDNFTLKNSMNFMGIPTVSLGIVNSEGDDYDIITRYDNGSYKKFIYKDNIIYGLISQGDISYIGVLTQLIKNKVEIPDLKSRIFDVGYSDFFAMKENGEFEYSI
ncbi:NAD(P)/FAD-dependent oxidoreductase [Romboutsia ilealis]|uniref:NAD(P)/FAD-dependent oxidoreductase n=1 Tax=Romboutsia faecis TaxID=2764597 RepID=A0ABR7JS87_9FIRM|nr:FAD-dependent oxidoreductase [Romboutsia faecis]MBC5997783.1 NAD(P)/FAD-dependent oxidoreductase [Romboutsia faecis]MRN25482.1 NAD(P)/FAD-dependent oxidoreductase [Romboutsia ilealis]